MLAGPLVVSLVLLGIGAFVRSAGRGDRWALLALVVATGAVAYAVASGHDPDVTGSDVFWGTAAGALAGFALPVAVSYAIGRCIADGVARSLVWAASLIPVGFGLFAVWLWTAALVNCPPDAYECPL